MKTTVAVLMGLISALLIYLRLVTRLESVLRTHPDSYGPAMNADAAGMDHLQVVKTTPPSHPRGWRSVHHVTLDRREEGFHDDVVAAVAASICCSRSRHIRRSYTIHTTGRQAVALSR